MAGLHGDLEQLQTSYRAFDSTHNGDADDDDLPPTYQSSGTPWYQRPPPRQGGVHGQQQGSKAQEAPQHGGDYESPTGGVLIHTVPEGNKSRWSHIEDLDSFFKNVYTYHQRHGFNVMILQKIFELFQVVFIIFLCVYAVGCVDYDVLFNKVPPEGKVPGQKVTISDVVRPAGECMTQFSFSTWIFLLVGLCFWAVKALATFYQVFQFWDIKLFYNQALHIADNELGSLTWRDVQRRLVEAQADHFMCIHKEHLTDLDICHRILRFKNYMVAMVNKDILPVRVSPLPCLPSFAFLSHGLNFNLEFLFFKGPWAPFDKWHLKDDYKKLNKKKDLTENLQNKILFVACVNLVMMPLIFIWQVLYCFFNYAELIKREPGSLGVRKWSHYGKLYLRHLNELDHELKARLNRAYKPANQYMDIFVSPMSVVIAKFLTFLAGSVLALLIALSVWDEDVLNVEHVLTLITVLGAIIAFSRVFIPDPNLVFCPEKTLTAVVAHIHYFPVHNWKGQAHTYEVMSHLNELFPYTANTLLQELVSPILTPFILVFMVRPRASAIIDFFRNFTVDVTGVGDVCSFAQMDVRRHGNPNWQQPAAAASAMPPSQQPEQVEGSKVQAKTNAYTQAEDGKTEMSLIHFTLANPDWKPPQESENFIAALRGHAAREAEVLPALQEDQLGENPLFSSLNSLDAAGGVYADIANNVLASLRGGDNTSAIGDSSLMVNQEAAAARGACSPIHSRQQNSMLQSIQQGMATGRSSVMTSIMPPPPNLRQDLRRLGLEYTSADMSLSALYMHEMYQRSLLQSQQHHHVGGGGGARSGRLGGAGPGAFVTTATAANYRRSLNDLEEESVPLVDTSDSSGLTQPNQIFSSSHVA